MRYGHELRNALFCILIQYWKTAYRFKLKYKLAFMTLLLVALI